MNEGNDRISLSRDTLRAELAALELRIVDRITKELASKADLAHVNSIESRLAAIELHGSPALVSIARDFAETEGRVAAVEREQLARAHLVEEHKDDHGKIVDLESWRNKFIGGGVLAIFLGGGALVRTFLGL